MENDIESIKNKLLKTNKAKTRDTFFRTYILSCYKKKWVWEHCSDRINNQNIVRDKIKCEGSEIDGKSQEFSYVESEIALLFHGILKEDYHHN